MKYAFLTALIPKQMEDEVRDCSRYNMQDAASVLQWHIYDGLSANIQRDIQIFNILPIGSFPQYYSKPFIKREVFDYASGKGNINIGFCNVKLFRKYHQVNQIWKELKKWCRETNESKTLFIYTASAPFMSAAAKLKAEFPTLKICTMIADLPDMTSLSSKKNVINQAFENKLASSSYAKLGCVDCFVLLTKQMADYMKLTKPYVVMEGISTAFPYPPRKNDDGIKRILYAGTLHQKFGVLNLLEAFREIDSPNYRLVICGIGDCESEIKKRAQEDSRILFQGQLKRKDVLKLQSEATVLVNPRQNHEEFTKYSFPSKNLEYLSSGIPLVAYKLDGIPDEYDEYINYVKDNSIDSLRDMLIKICEDVDGSAATRAARAMHFVRSEKNAQKQTLKIVEMINAL